MPEGSGHSLEDNVAKSSSKRQGAALSAGSDPRMSQQGLPQRAGSGVSAFKVQTCCWPLRARSFSGYASFSDCQIWRNGMAVDTNSIPIPIWWALRDLMTLLLQTLPNKSANVRRPPTRAESIASEVSRSAAERSPADEGESSGVAHGAARRQQPGSN